MENILIFLVILLMVAIILGPKMIHKNLNKKIFGKGKLRYGTVVGYLDYKKNRYTDNSKDCIYNGGNSTATSYITVILYCYDDFSKTEEIYIQDYGLEDKREILLSERFPIGMQVNFYEYKGNYRFATDKWLAK